MNDYKTRKRFYNSKDWETVRLIVLKRDNFECRWCKEEGKVTTEDLKLTILQNCKIDQI